VPADSDRQGLTGSRQGLTGSPPASSLGPVSRLAADEQVGQELKRSSHGPAALGRGQPGQVYGHGITSASARLDGAQRVVGGEFEVGIASCGRVATSRIGRPSIAGCLDAGRAPVQANACRPVPVEDIQPSGVDAAGDFSGVGIDGVYTPGGDELGSAARDRA